jgi:hypothetical protein
MDTLFDLSEIIEGENVRYDKIHRNQYLTGCDRISIQAPMKKDGNIPDWYTFDIHLGKIIEKKTIDMNSQKEVKLSEDNKKDLKKLNKKGGPQPKPEKW